MISKSFLNNNVNFYLNSLQALQLQLCRRNLTLKNRVRELLRWWLLKNQHAHCVTACTRKKFKFSRIAHINELKYFNCLQTGLRHAVVAMLCQILLHIVKISKSTRRIGLRGRRPRVPSYNRRIPHIMSTSLKVSCFQLQLYTLLSKRKKKNINVEHYQIKVRK